MGTFKDIITGGAETAIKAGIGLMMGNKSDERALEMDRQRMEMQIEGSKRLTDYNNRQNLAMWEKTNSAAMADEYRKHGLNVGLMYNAGGAGGQTVQNQPANVTAGSSNSRSMEGMAMMVNTQLMQAQKANIEADTKKKEIEANKMAGADTANVEAQTKNLLQGVENQKAVEALTNVQTNLAKIQESIAGRTENDVVTYAAWNAQNKIS